MARTNLGRVVPIHKGDFSATSEYELNDIVAYNGSTYWHYARNKTAGVPPTDGTVWRLVINVTEAEEYIERAETAARLAEGYADDAETAQTAAESAKEEAESAEQIVISAKQDVVVSEENARAYMTAAQTAKGQAETARSGAVEAKTGADNAKVQAESAKDASSAYKGAAETAKTAAETAQTAAESAKSDAVTAKNDAVAAKTAAETAQIAAESAKSDAEIAEGNADDSAEDSEAWAVGKRDGVAVPSTDPAYNNNAKYYAQQAESAAQRTYKRYIARWNKSQAQMTRMGDAENITTTTTDFGHFGSVNPNYSNPFDTLYPWSERRLCNIDIPTYMALTAGSDIRDCVVAWEGDTVFSYDHPHGVWVYTPEFWGDSYDDGTYRYYEVCDRAVNGKHHFPAQIGGRWHGRVVTLTIGGTDKSCLIPSPGMPGKRIAMSTLHTYAKNWGATLDNIWSMDASTLLYLVEYAHWNTQTKLGSGVSDLYRQSSDTIQGNTTGTVVKILASAGNTHCIPGAIFDIGTTNGGVEVGSYQVISREVDETDSTILNVTLDREVTVTTAHYWSVHGLCNVANSEIGGKSGYIGTNGKSIAYYRGEEFFGNLWRYVLGAYHQATTNHVWLAHNAVEANNYDGISTTAHIDTGVALAATEGYVNALAEMRANGVFAAPACIAVGGSSSNPVGDYHYIATGSNTVLIVGGGANYGTGGGRCCGYWSRAASLSHWACGAVPLLKTP